LRFAVSRIPSPSAAISAGTVTFPVRVLAASSKLTETVAPVLSVTSAKIGSIRSKVSFVASGRHSRTTTSAVSDSPNPCAIRNLFAVSAEF